MKNSTIKGKINNAKTASALDINLDNSSFIELTGNSYYTSLNNDDKQEEYSQILWLVFQNLILIHFQ